MAHEINRTKLIGGLNYDDENRVIPAQDYRFAENLRNSIKEIGRAHV